jgi:non-ribosomal peptide synthase protein (TIGR01720 family)
LIIDGVSWRIILEDLQECYREASNGEKIKLPPKTTSFKQWAQRLNEHAQSASVRQSLDYWLEELSGSIRSVPVDDVTGVNSVASAATVRVELSEAETDALLHDLPAAYRTQINDVLLTALVQAYAEWSSNRKLLVDVEGHGREESSADVDVTRTVGWFTTYYPVCLEAKRGARGLEVLKSTKERLRRTSKHRMTYGLLRYLCADQQTAERIRALPQAEVIFNYLGQFDPTVLEKSNFALATEYQGETQSRNEMRSYLFEINSRVVGRRLGINWGYSRNLHQRATSHWRDWKSDSYTNCLEASVELKTCIRCRPCNKGYFSTVSTNSSREFMWYSKVIRCAKRSMLPHLSRRGSR